MLYVYVWSDDYPEYHERLAAMALVVGNYKGEYSWLTTSLGAMQS